MKRDRLAPLLVVLLVIVLFLGISHFTSFSLNIFAFAGVALLSNLNAKDLFERCAARTMDRAAWKDFFERFSTDIEGTVRRIVGYPGHGRYFYLFDDIVQRFYQRLLENDRRALHALRGIEERQAHAYLRTIAAGVAYKMIGHEHPAEMPLEGLEQEDGESGMRYHKASLAAEDELGENEIALLISMNSALHRILRGRNKYRNMLIFKLVALDGFSPKEITYYSCFRMRSRHAIEQLVSRTRQKLRAWLKL